MGKFNFEIGAVIFSAVVHRVNYNTTTNYCDIEFKQKYKQSNLVDYPGCKVTVPVRFDSKLVENIGIETEFQFKIIDDSKVIKDITFYGDISLFKRHNNVIPAINEDAEPEFTSCHVAVADLFFYNKEHQRSHRKIVLHSDKEAVENLYCAVMEYVSACRMNAAEVNSKSKIDKIEDYVVRLLTDSNYDIKEILNSYFEEDDEG